MRKISIAKKVAASVLAVALAASTVQFEGQMAAADEAQDAVITQTEENVITEAATETVTASQEGKVVLSVEKFTIGQGFVVEPVEVSFKGETTIADIFTEVMNEKKIEFVNGSTNGTFYLSSIKNADNGTVNIPSAISDMEPYNQYWISEDTFVYPPTNDSNDGNEDFPNLGEFAYCNMAGWMFTRNGELSSDYASAEKVSDGDVIRFQFTVYGYGADLGIGYGIPANLEIPEKEDLIAALAKANNPKYLSNSKVKAMYEKAIAAASSYDSTEKDIMKAETALNAATDVLDVEETTTEEVTTQEITTAAVTTAAPTTQTVTTTAVPTTAAPTTAVSVQKAVINSVKNVKGKKAKVTLKKIKGVNGYQIKYSTSKKFKKATTKTTKKITYTIKKLSKNKKYYIKARAYRLVNKKKYYGSWSKVKKVIIRK